MVVVVVGRVVGVCLESAGAKPPPGLLVTFNWRFVVIKQPGEKFEVPRSSE